MRIKHFLLIGIVACFPFMLSANPIKDLLGSDYIAVVKAEDRFGEIIAQSRGIAVSGNKSYP